MTTTILNNNKTTSFGVSDEQIVLDFNSEMLTVKKMSEKYGIKQDILKTRIAKLQRAGIIGRKNKVGKIVAPPRKFKYKYDKKNKVGSKIYEHEKKSNSKKPSLSDMLGDIDSKVEKTSISTLHKEMLVEILHKLIV